MINIAGWLAFLLVASPVYAGVSLPPARATDGYVCRLLINEVPFPGERSYRSEQDTMAAMDQLLHVLDGRLKNVPKPYTQRQIAATTADDIIDVITAGGEKGQFDGFYRDAAGQPAMVSRVTTRVDNLVSIANKGTPGKFARLLNHASQLATTYVKGKLEAPDRYDALGAVQGVPVTGGAFSWMTDEMRFNPGGNFLRIPDDQQGSLGGNRFFTLRKEPR